MSLRCAADVDVGADVDGGDSGDGQTAREQDRIPGSLLYSAFADQSKGLFACFACFIACLLACLRVSLLPCLFAIRSPLCLDAISHMSVLFSPVYATVPGHGTANEGIYQIPVANDGSTDSTL
jgi:hypothetical protein